MGVLNKGKEFGATETVTSDKLHQLVEDATFSSGAVDGVSIVINPGDGKLKINNGGVKTSQIADESITPAKMEYGSGNLTDRFTFEDVSGRRHFSNQYNKVHNSVGPLTFNMQNGNYQFVTVSANIEEDASDAVLNIVNDSFYAGAHFTFVLYYAANSLIGPGTGTWGSKWLFPNGYDGTLTMTNGTFDIISGIIVNQSNNYKYLANVIKNYTNP